MSEELQWHRKFAVDLFNLTWEYLDKPERTIEDNDLMLNAAHASRYHWEVVGTPVNLARGEWQLSRVYSVLGRPEPAQYHARRCLEICEENEIGDFDLAYAYEALARAYAVASQMDKSHQYLELARQAGEKIAEEDDKALFISDIKTLPA